MPYAVPYMRFSFSRQGRGSSIERQEMMIGEWLGKHPEYTLYPKTYKDLGRSGFSGEHLKFGFGKMLKAIEDGLISSGDVILVEAFDRAGRLPPSDMFPILSGIVKAGVNIVTLDDGITYTLESVNNNHLFLLLAKIQQAHNYSSLLSDRIKKSYANRVDRAKAGEKVKVRTPIWLKDGELIEDLVPIIRQVFELWAEGVGAWSILKKIQDQHPALKKVNVSTISEWVRNKTAIGYWRDIPGVYPAVVDAELFYRANNRPVRSIPTRNPRKHFETGLIVCGVCGGNMVSKIDKLKSAKVVCGTRSRKGIDACSNSKNFPLDVFLYLITTTSTEAMQQALRRHQLSDSEKKAIVLRGKVDELGKQLSNLYKLAAINLTDELQQEIERKIFERDQAQVQIKALEVISSVNEDWGAAVEISDDMRIDEPERANALLRSVGYALKAFTNGTIEVPCKDINGIELNPCKYEGYSKRKDAYILSTGSGVLEILNFASKRHLATLEEY
ncbi:recombinase family protein [Aquipseudomonas guryensis]|uniref:Recombinase family protein n=1 Tax=Aquipseudomonas guryensis TaxID=2759165 RepID=A0A7W4DBC9_9GAMM|nr:recombinase family protein [Pseudomonas guryensis]MBB1519464.1 recombinase family protein [Pseudomonas guryensis]